MRSENESMNKVFDAIKSGEAQYLKLLFSQLIKVETSHHKPLTQLSTFRFTELTRNIEACVISAHKNSHVSFWLTNSERMWSIFDTHFFFVVGNEKASIDGIQDLIRNGQINIVDSSGYNALHWAAIKGEKMMRKYKIEISTIPFNSIYSSRRCQCWRNVVAKWLRTWSHRQCRANATTKGHRSQ